MDLFLQSQTADGKFIGMNLSSTPWHQINTQQSIMNSILFKYVRSLYFLVCQNTLQILFLHLWSFTLAQPVIQSNINIFCFLSLLTWFGKVKLLLIWTAGLQLSFLTLY